MNLSSLTLVATLLSALCIPLGAQAQAPRIPVHIERIGGPAGNQVTNALRRVLRQQPNIESVSSASAQTRMGVVFIRGEVARDGRALRAELRVHSADGALVGDVQATAANPARLVRTIRRGVWGELEPLLQDAVAALEGGEGPALNLVVRDFLGPESAPTQNAVEARLRLRRNLTLRTINAPMTRASDYMAAARQHRIAAFVEGDIERGRDALRLVVTVRGGMSGEVVAELRLSGATASDLRQAIRAQLWARLGDAIESTRPPEPEAEEAAGSPAPPVEEADEGYTGPRPSPLTFSVGARLFSRSYTYTDDLFSQLNGYRLKAGPELLLSLQWYPLAHFRGGALADIGIEGHTSLGLAIGTVDGPETRDTHANEWGAALVYRLSFGPVRLRFGAGVGGQVFAIDGTDLLPEASYFFARFSFAGAVELTRGLDVEFAFGWRHLLSVGEFDDAEWFPRSTGAGLDGRLGVGYRFTDMWAVHLSFDLRRYFFSMNPEPGDRWIAGGALDQYLGGSLRFSFRWPASEDSSESEIEEGADGEGRLDL